MNTVFLIGNLGHSPEVKTVGDVKVASLSLATTTKWKNPDGSKVERTEWHRLVMWRGLAEIAEKYLEKGSKIAVTGEIRYRTYTDRDNVERKVTEINVEKMEMLGAPKEQPRPESNVDLWQRTPESKGDASNMFNDQQQTAALEATMEDDDLPF